MDMLYDGSVVLQANTKEAWYFLTSLEQRPFWQLGVEKVQLISGTEGVRGAKSLITLKESDGKCSEKVIRSTTLTQLQIITKVDNCSYHQTITLTKVGKDLTRLNYYCKRQLHTSWRSILRLHPKIPTCVDSHNYETLVKYAHAKTRRRKERRLAERKKAYRKNMPNSGI